MRNIVIIAAVLIGAGTLMGQMAARSTMSPPASATVASATSSPKPKQVSAPSGPRVVSVERDRRGHFQVEGRIDGRDMSFMVDTGASVVALTAESASRLNIRPMSTDYTVNVSTANGSVKAARVTLRNVDVGGLRVDDVSALVLPQGALTENLLGLSYLSKLRRYEFAGSRLVLEQ